MRIRLPFAVAFFLLLLFSAYLGLTPLQLPFYINDKLLHFITFFLITISIYWIPDTTRRRTLHLTLFISLFLSLSSEVLQEVLDNGRDFDLYDIVANVVGSLTAIGLSGWYHKRMLERRRRAKGYVAVDGEDLGGDVDLELGEGLGRGLGDEDDGQESGIVHSEMPPPARVTSLEEAVDNWDENDVDNWDEDHVDSADGEGPKTPSASSAGEAETDLKEGN